jgi:hypothetical protein
LSGSETHHLSEMPPPRRWVSLRSTHPTGLSQEVDVIDETTQAALSQIGREEKAAAADKVSPIVRHRASVARLKVMGFATLNPSYGLDKQTLVNIRFAPKRRRDNRRL